MPLGWKSKGRRSKQDEVVDRPLVALHLVPLQANSTPLSLSAASAASSPHLQGHGEAAHGAVPWLPEPAQHGAEMDRSLISDLHRRLHLPGVVRVLTQPASCSDTVLVAPAAEPLTPALLQSTSLSFSAILHGIGCVAQAAIDLERRVDSSLLSLCNTNIAIASPLHHRPSPHAARWLLSDLTTCVDSTTTTPASTPAAVARWIAEGVLPHLDGSRVIEGHLMAQQAAANPDGAAHRARSASVADAEGVEGDSSEHQHPFSLAHLWTELESQFAVSISDALQSYTTGPYCTEAEQDWWRALLQWILASNATLHRCAASRAPEALSPDHTFSGSPSVSIPVPPGEKAENPVPHASGGGTDASHEEKQRSPPDAEDEAGTQQAQSPDGSNDGELAQRESEPESLPDVQPAEPPTELDSQPVEANGVCTPDRDDALSNSAKGNDAGEDVGAEEPVSKETAGSPETNADATVAEAVPPSHLSEPDEERTDERPASQRSVLDEVDRQTAEAEAEPKDESRGDTGERSRPPSPRPLFLVAGSPATRNALEDPGMLSSTSVNVHAAAGQAPLPSPPPVATTVLADLVSILRQGTGSVYATPLRCLLDMADALVGPMSNARSIATAFLDGANAFQRLKHTCDILRAHLQASSPGEGAAGAVPNDSQPFLNTQPTAALLHALQSFQHSDVALRVVPWVFAPATMTIVPVAPTAASKLFTGLLHPATLVSWGPRTAAFIRCLSARGFAAIRQGARDADARRGFVHVATHCCGFEASAAHIWRTLGPSPPSFAGDHTTTTPVNPSAGVGLSPGSTFPNAFLAQFLIPELYLACFTALEMPALATEQPEVPPAGGSSAGSPPPSGRWSLGLRSRIGGVLTALEDAAARPADTAGDAVRKRRLMEAAEVHRLVAAHLGLIRRALLPLYARATELARGMEVAAAEGTPSDLASTDAKREMLQVLRTLVASRVIPWTIALVDHCRLAIQAVAHLALTATPGNSPNTSTADATKVGLLEADTPPPSTNTAAFPSSVPPGLSTSEDGSAEPEEGVVSTQESATAETDGAEGSLVLGGSQRTEDGAPGQLTKFPSPSPSGVFGPTSGSSRGNSDARWDSLDTLLGKTTERIGATAAQCAQLLVDFLGPMGQEGVAATPPPSAAPDPSDQQSAEPAPPGAKHRGDSDGLGTTRQDALAALQALLLAATVPATRADTIRRVLHLVPPAAPHMQAPRTDAATSEREDTITHVDPSGVWDITTASGCATPPGKEVDEATVEESLAMELVYAANRGPPPMDAAVQLLPTLLSLSGSREGVVRHAAATVARTIFRRLQATTTTQTMQADRCDSGTVRRPDTTLAGGVDLMAAMNSGKGKRRVVPAPVVVVPPVPDTHRASVGTPDALPLLYATVVEGDAAQATRPPTTAAPAAPPNVLHPEPSSAEAERKLTAEETALAPPTESDPSEKGNIDERVARTLVAARPATIFTRSECLERLCRLGRQNLVVSTPSAATGGPTEAASSAHSDGLKRATSFLARAVNKLRNDGPAALKVNEPCPFYWRDKASPPHRLYRVSAPWPLD